MDAGRSGSRFESMYIKEKINSCATVKPDGKLDLSVREKIPMQMDKDAEVIFKRMQAMGGKLPFNDKADAELIKTEFNMSKNAFKRAVGRLLKEGKIEITETSIKIKK